MNAKPPGKQDSTNRQKRLAEELRANLARRKIQARSRREGQADEREEGIPATRDDKKD